MNSRPFFSFDRFYAFLRGAVGVFTVLFLLQGSSGQQLDFGSSIFSQQQGLGVQSSSSAPAKVELISELPAVVAGQRFEVFLRIEHQGKWHSYWRNPGLSSYSPIFSWDLPTGVEFLGVEYAVPKKLSTAGVPGYGFEGETFHILNFAVAEDVKAGENLEIKGKVDLLLCDDQNCVPLLPLPSLNFSLPVVAETEQLEGQGTQASELIALAKAQQPQRPDWPSSWRIEQESLLWQVELPNEQTAQKFAQGEFWGAEIGSSNSLTDLNVPASLRVEGKTLFVEAALVAGASEQVGERSGWGGLLKLPDGEAVYVTALREGFESEGGGVAASGDATQPQARLTLQMLLFAVLGGLILNVMPCVFPVLGLKVMNVVSQAGGKRSHIVGHGLIYTLGVILSFLAIGFILIGFRAANQATGIGVGMESLPFLFAMLWLLFLFGLNLMGVFEVGVRLTGAGQGLQQKAGMVGSFFTGILAVIVATPCVGPLLGWVMGIALLLPDAEILAVMAAVGLGLALPFLLLSVFPALVEKLPRPGAWMENFKIVMGFLLFGSAGFLLFIYLGQLQAREVDFIGWLFSLPASLGMILALSLLGLAAWIYGRFVQRGKAKLASGLSAGLLTLVALGIAWPTPSSIVWEKWTPETEAQLRESGTPYFIDFTAVWCANCQTNKATYIGSSEVARLAESKGVVMLKADWTDRGNTIFQRLQSIPDNPRAGIPVNLLWHKGLEEPKLLPEIFGANTVKDSLNQVP